MLIVLVAGFAALTGLPRQEDPEIIQRFGLVRTLLPGASAERVETLVTQVLESRLRGIEEVNKAEIEATSRKNISILNIQLHDWVGDGENDTVWSEVRSELAAAAADLPAEASSPELEVADLSVHAMLVAIRPKNNGDWREQDLHRMVRLGERLEELLNAISGTKQTRIFGAPQEEVQVWIAPEAVANYGVAVEEVARALAGRDSRVSGGTLIGGNTGTAIELEDVAGSLDAVRALTVLPGVRLDSVADVELGFETPKSVFARVGGRPAVVVATRIERESRIDKWTETARAQVETFAESLPPDLEATIFFEQDHYVSKRLEGLAGNLGLAVLIVVFVLIFFLGFKAASLLGLALVLSVMATLALMRPSGLYFQQMSVTGLIISLGLLIDNPIVSVEFFQSLRKRGVSVIEAVSQTGQHLWVPLLASSATTAFAFLPIAISAGPTSEFVGSMAVMVIFSLIASLGLALTIVLALAGVWGIGSGASHSLVHQGLSFAWLTALYRRSLIVIVRRPWVGVLVGLTLPILGFALITAVPRSFFPSVDRDMFEIQVQLPADATADATYEVAKSIEAFLEEYPQIKESHWFVGERSPRFYYNAISSGSDFVSSHGRGYVLTESAEATHKLLPELDKALRSKYAGIYVRATPFNQGPPIFAPIEISVIGDDLSVLEKLGDEVRLRLSNLDGVVYTLSGLSGSVPTLKVSSNWEEMAVSGIGENEIARGLAAQIDGVVASYLIEGDRQIPIRVRAKPLQDASSRFLQPLAGASSGESVLDTVWEPSVPTIERRAGQRRTLVQAWVTPYALPLPIQQEFLQDITDDPIQLPEGYAFSFQGESGETDQSTARLLETAQFFIVMMLVVIVISMRSFRRAAIVGIVAFLSLGLAMFGITISGQPLGFIGIVGSLGLVGLAVNGAIIVLSALMASAKAMQGNVEETADTVVNATRHILATTFTTIGGFMPLILFGETFWLPLAWAMVGGVGGSAVLALYMVPAMFSSWGNEKRQAMASKDITVTVEPA